MSDHPENRGAETATPSPREVTEWLTERLNNCHAIAARKQGADRASWLEDAAFFSAAINGLAEAKRLHTEAIEWWESACAERDAAIEWWESACAERDAANARADKAEAEAASWEQQAADEGG